MNLYCAHCQYKALHFKDLIDHYEANHAQYLKWYQVRHRPTGSSAITQARSAQEACEVNDWLIGDCFVREMRNG